MKWSCEICGVDIGEPRMCCDGSMCGCQGMPIDPPVCSEDCYDKLMNKYRPVTVLWSVGIPYMVGIISAPNTRRPYYTYRTEARSFGNVSYWTSYKLALWRLSNVMKWEATKRYCHCNDPEQPCWGVGGRCVSCE